MITDFDKAEPGDRAYIYDVRALDWDIAWVTRTEYFDDLDDTIKIPRQLWQLVDEDTVTFPGRLELSDEEANE